MAVQPRQQPAFSTAMIQSDVYIDTTCDCKLVKKIANIWRTTSPLYGPLYNENKNECYHVRDSVFALLCWTISIYRKRCLFLSSLDQRMEGEGNRTELLLWFLPYS